MHTVSNRANTALTFFGTVAAVLCVLVTITDVFHQSNPAISVQLEEVKKLSLHRGKQDQVALALKLDADLRSEFSWNTKQLFVFVQAEYVTPENKVNQVVLWDRIVQRQKDAHLKVRSMRLKYPFIDQGKNLRGLPYNITVAWDVMPKVGRLFIRSKSFPMDPLPADYIA
jgi:signal peptidase complex subunit 3